MPTTSQSGGRGSSRRTRAMSSASVRSETTADISAPTHPAPLLRVVHRTRFPDDGDLDLAGVFQLVLDAPRDVLGEPDRLFLRNLLAFDHDSNLAPGLEAESLRNALESVSDAFQLFQPLHVGLQNVAARAGTSRGDRVGGLHDHRFE